MMLSSVATHRRVGSLRGWLQHDVLDIETDDYLAAVAEGLDPLAHASRPLACRLG